MYSTILSAEQFHQFCGHILKSTDFVDKPWIPLISWSRCSASSAENVHFFRGIQKSFPTTRTRTKRTTIKTWTTTKILSYYLASKTRKVQSKIAKETTIYKKYVWNDKMPSNISLNFTYLMKFRQVFKIDIFHQLHGNFISMEAFDGIFFFLDFKKFS